MVDIDIDCFQWQGREVSAGGIRVLWEWERPDATLAWSYQGNPPTRMGFLRVKSATIRARGICRILWQKQHLQIWEVADDMSIAQLYKKTSQSGYGLFSYARREWSEP